MKNIIAAAALSAMAFTGIGVATASIASAAPVEFTYLDREQKAEHDKKVGKSGAPTLRTNPLMKPGFEPKTGVREVKKAGDGKKPPISFR